jgi:hypothetical protein
MQSLFFCGLNLRQLIPQKIQPICFGCVFLQRLDEHIRGIQAIFLRVAPYGFACRSAQKKSATKRPGAPILEEIAMPKYPELLLAPRKLPR